MTKGQACSGFGEWYKQCIEARKNVEYLGKYTQHTEGT